MNSKTTALLLAVATAGTTFTNAFEDAIYTKLNYADPLLGNDRCALVNIAMDESGSMKREQKFMKEYAIPRLAHLLHSDEYQYDHVFFCTNGFGWSGASPENHYFRHIGCTVGAPEFPSGIVDDSVTAWENTSGGEWEDGYHAIVESISAVPAEIIDFGGQLIDIRATCGHLKNNIILVTDEDRDVLNEDLDAEKVRKAISDANYILNEVVEVIIQIPDDLITEEDYEIGIRADYPIENLDNPTIEEVCTFPDKELAELLGFDPGCRTKKIYDLKNEFFTTNKASGRMGDWKDEHTSNHYDRHLTNGRGGDTIADYFPLIQETRGAMWSIGPLRASMDNVTAAVTDQNTVEAWAEAFVDIKVAEIDCSECNTCPNPPCRISELGGDPHITTWRNEHYEYHGQCDLVMLKDPEFANGLGIDVHVRTKLVRYWSYIKSVAIRIGNDILEIQGNGGAGEDDDRQDHYWINYEYQGEIEKFAGFPVTHNSPNYWKRRWTIDLGPEYANEFITVQTYKEFVRVSFSGGKSSFGNTVGLMGDFYSGKTLARDGQTVLNDFTELGQEWQVQPSEPKLFHANEDPQFPELCLEPEDPRGDRHRRLEESNISIEEAEKACKTLKDPLARKDCVYDILATQDIDMVGAF